MQPSLPLFVAAMLGQRPRCPISAASALDRSPICCAPNRVIWVAPHPSPGVLNNLRAPQHLINAPGYPSTMHGIAIYRVRDNLIQDVILLLT